MQEVSRALGGPGQGPREKELGSHLSQRGVCAVLTLHKPRFPAGSALVQGSLENEKRPGVKAEEDAVGLVPPSFPLPSSKPGPSQEEPASGKVERQRRSLLTSGTCVWEVNTI